MSLIAVFVWRTESSALTLPCATCANICGIRNFEKSSSIAAARAIADAAAEVRETVRRARLPPI